MAAGNQPPPPEWVVLIVEDDHESLGILRLMIARKFSDIAVYIAETGEAGIEFCRDRHPDIVVTDINLPGISGIQMATEIKRRKPDTKFIVLTGCSDMIHQQQFIAIGVHNFLVKPVDMKLLFAAIQECMDAL